MGLLQKLFGLVWPKYKRRQQMIAWLTLEGWEPKIMYRAKGYEYPSLICGKHYLQGDNLGVSDVKNAGYPFIAATWGIFSTADLNHLVVAVGWAKEKP